MLDQVTNFLQRPLVYLSGAPVTTVSLLIAILIVIVARIVGGLVARTSRRVLASQGADEGVQFAIAKILRYLATIIGLLIAVSTVGIDMTTIVAASAVLLVGIGFGLQKVAENFISGLILLVERPVRKGDFIHVAGTVGTVQDVGLRATRVVSRDGVMMIIPNAELVSGTVVNRTAPTSLQRIQVKVGVAYGSDLARARSALLDVARAEARVLPAPAPNVQLSAFGDASLELILEGWIADTREDLVIASALRFAIDDAFRAAGVEIPSPERHLAAPAPVPAVPARPPTPAACLPSP